MGVCMVKVVRRQLQLREIDRKSMGGYGIWRDVAGGIEGGGS